MGSSDFKRIISNLLNNAFEAVEKEGEVTLRLSKHEKMLEVEIIDTGRGIPLEILPRIGERAFSYGKDGNGFGVSHAKEVLEKNNGKFDITSKINEGTTVTLYLPVR